MPGIFISYRRSSSSTTTYRLVDDLRRVFGAEQIFLDVESIEPGIPFAQAIQKSLQKSSVALIMIGPQWANLQDKQGNPRLQDSHDWVRQEVRAALASGARVIPVLIEGGTMPEEDELPDDIKALTQLQAFTLLPSQTHWAFDVKRLIDNISAIDPALKSIVTPRPHTDILNQHYSYKVIGGFALYLITVLLLGFENPIDSDTILGGIFFLLVAGMLFVFGLIDIRNGLVRGKKGAITGIVLCSLGVIGHSISYSQKLGEEQSSTAANSSQNAAQFDNANNHVDNTAAAHAGYVNQADFGNDEGSAPAATPAAYEQNASLIFSGVWIAQNGSRLQIVQRDADVTFNEFNAFGAQVGQGAGSVSDQQLNFNYYNPVLNINATGTAIMRGNNTLYIAIAYSGQQFDYIYYRQ